MFNCASASGVRNKVIYKTITNLLKFIEMKALQTLSLLPLVL